MNKQLRNLRAAIEETERVAPLPRCTHGSCLVDGAGERLEPPCGCRLKTPINPSLILAVEYGYKGAEHGWNLDMTIAEFKKVMQ